MPRSAYIIGVVLFTLFAAGCAGQGAAPDPVDPGTTGPGGGPPGGGGTDADPVALIGLWSVTGAAGEEADAVLRIAPESLSLWRDCGTLMGAWQADTGGSFVADVDSSAGCPASEPLAPQWLRGATAYRVAGKERVLLDGHGEPVARLLPGGRPKPNPNVAPQEAQPPVVTDEIRRALARSADLAPGLVAPGRDALVGRWSPEDGPDRAFLEFRADGSWVGSDGCNGLGGRWVAGADGALLATSGPSTLIGCDNVPVGAWLVNARRAGLDEAEADGERLVLVDATGKELGRLRTAR